MQKIAASSGAISLCIRISARGGEGGEHAEEKPPEEEAPFVGRVALLLDPSMLEQARRAARKFHGERRDTGAKTFAEDAG